MFWRKSVLRNEINKFVSVLMINFEVSIKPKNYELSFLNLLAFR